MRGGCRGWKLVFGQPETCADGLRVPGVLPGVDEDSGTVKSERECVDLFNEVVADGVLAQCAEVPVELHAEGSGMGFAGHGEVQGAFIGSPENQDLILRPVGLWSLTSGHSVCFQEGIGGLQRHPLGIGRGYSSGFCGPEGSGGSAGPQIEGIPDRAVVSRSREAFQGLRVPVLCKVGSFEVLQEIEEGVQHGADGDDEEELAGGHGGLCSLSCFC